MSTRPEITGNREVFFAKWLKENIPNVEIAKSMIREKKDLFFSGWCREKLTDSKDGLLITDIDFILKDYKTRRMMILEVKTRGAGFKNWQRSIYQTLGAALERSLSMNSSNDNLRYDWRGAHFIKFENTNFADGKVFLNYKESSEEEIKNFLSLK
jgi:hypothetical protein